jgi:hypothetical protein
MKKPEAKRDFQELRSRFINNIPTTFVRFSDGELEILRNNPLSITDGVVRWRLGTLDGRYPQHDNKSFVPERDIVLRSDLIASARYKSNGYFKGVPASSNKAAVDRNYMIDLNDGDFLGLTFSDLFINENYLGFIKDVLPLFLENPNVAFVGNYRASLSKLSETWSHVPIDDNVFPVYEAIFPKLLETLTDLEPGSVVLSSASSLSNTLGHQLHQARPDITFVDVGTSLNPFVGLGEATRAYQTQLLPWSPKNASRKLKYQLLGSHRMKW